jgi:hypothetical protein
MPQLPLLAFDDAQTRFIPQGRFAFKGDAGEA